MSKRSAAGRRRSKRSARPESRVRRIAVAIGTVILVITPISWILLHQPQSNEADASVPYVTRDDDSYIKSSTEPVVATASPTKPASTPSSTPTSATPSPSRTPSVPRKTPTTSPTDGPTEGPTDSPTDGPTTGETSSTPTEEGPVSQPPKPSQSTSGTPSSPPSTSTPPPPPADGGSMHADEQELFTLVDNERTARGCAPLQRDSGLTGGARQDAESRAENGDVSDSSSSMAAAGGDGVSAKAAFDKLKSQSSGTLFNCGHSELGVGHDNAQYCKSSLLGICLGTAKRDSWVVDFQ